MAGPVTSAGQAGRQLAACVGAALLLLGCHQIETHRIDPYCLTDGDCGANMICVARFCQVPIRHVDSPPASPRESRASGGATPPEADAETAPRPARRKPDHHQRTALVIGNANYESVGRLKNPVNDARAIDAALRRVGFEVDLQVDLTLPQMQDAVSRFADRLRQRRGVGLFFYAGHGIEMQGVNYLLPVSTPQELHEGNLKFQAVPADSVLDEMANARTDLSVVILDACRDNPLAGTTRSARRGLAQMDAPPGAIILMAAGAGKVAFDGDGQNGIFTKHLVVQIVAEGLSIENAFKEAGRRVYEETYHRQHPEYRTSYFGDFYFVPARR